MLRFIYFWLHILLQLSSIDVFAAFIGRSSTPTFYNINKQHHHHHHHESRRESALASTTETASGRDIERNMFHDYDKPILILGCSGEGKELRRVAESFLVDQGNDSSSSSIIQATSIDSAGKIHLDADKLMKSIDTRDRQWPSIILFDFNDELIASNEERNVQDIEPQYTTIAQRLYEESELLSVYINVHPDDSKMNNQGKERKKRLEENVFVKYSDYELCIRDEGIASESSDNWDHILWEMDRIIARARLIPAIPGDTTRSSNSAHLTMGDHTFFLSLSFPDIAQVEPYVEKMCEDVDAMEYRTDLLDCRDSRFDLIYGMQLLRRYCRPHVVRVPALPCFGQVIEDVMPIVYTVRTQGQAGTYPDDKVGIAKMFEMLEWGLRAGVEVLDVESAWDETKTDNLLKLSEQRYASQILGSHHVVGVEVSTEQAVQLFQQCALGGRAHGAKVVLSIESEDKDRMAYEAATIASSLAASSNLPVIPNISLILGDVGQFSRVLNFPFTPVTHESLPFKAAPGQLTASEIMTTRVLTNILKKKVYCILGHNIAYSVSPQMQSAAFGAVRLPHKYLRADLPSVDEFAEKFIHGEDFGGASVTIPHKQSILKYVDVQSDAVKAIGSCNTLIVKDEVQADSDTFKRVIYGDNTDWKGIFNPLDRLLGGNVDSEKDCALILGAGGTARAAAYVASKLGLQRIYYNRTPEKAKDLEDEFGGVLITSLEEGPADGEGKSLGDVLTEKNSAVRVVISTLPAAALFELPKWLLSPKRKKPIIFDVNYKPYSTKLLEQAESSGCDIVRGSEMLWEQGIGQFELWTNRTAPYSVMKQVVLKNCLTSDEEAEISKKKS